MAQLMSQTEFAAHRGVGKSAVSNWKSAGLLVFAEDPARPGKQLVDVAKTEMLLRGSIDPTRGRPKTSEVAAIAEGETPAAAPAPRGPAPLSSLEEARLDQLRENTRGKRLETDQKLGTLVPIAEYERRAGDMGRMVRERTHALIRQEAERLAAETDPRQIMAILGEAFDRLFDHLADEIEAEASKEREVDDTLAPIAAAEADEDAEDLAIEP